MNPLVGVLVLVLLGLLGARLSFTTTRGPLGPRLIFSTGTHFLFLGFLLGSNVVGLLSRQLIDELYPFLALGLGWIGLLFGLQLDRRNLRQFPRRYLLVAIGQAVLAFGVFWAIGELVLVQAAGAASDEARTALLAAAATACISTPVGIALVSDTYQVRGRLAQLLFFVASLDALVGIVALQFTYSLHHPHGFGTPLLLTSAIRVGDPMEWILLSTALGAAFGVLFLWLSRPDPGREELALFLLGISIFGGGAALYLGLSPLFVCSMAGIVIANLFPVRTRVYELLQAWEKPIYVILLILAGALLDFATWVVLPLSVLYLAGRTLAKVAGGWGATRLARIRFGVPAGVGLGLLPQGGISLAMAISITLSYPALRLEGVAAIGDLVFAVVVLGVLASELVGPFMTRRLLRRAGEISPRTEKVVAEKGATPAPAEFPAAQRRRGEG